MISFRLVLKFFAMLALWMPGRSSAGFSEDRLTPLDFMREEATNVSRAGIVDQVTYNNKMFGFCHIAIYQAFTRLVSETRQPFDLENAFVAASAVYLAIDMLNKGDGSVIKEIEGLNERCPIRFTGESFDSALSQAGTLEQTLEVLDRTTPNQREVCAFLGAAWSPVTIVMAMVTGLYGRPQLSAISAATQLDDKSTFPLFGRLITSVSGNIHSLIFYLKQKDVQHIGVLLGANQLGSSWIANLLEKSAKLYPELKVVAVEIHGQDATREDLEEAMEALKKTGIRYFSTDTIGPSEFELFAEVAISKGIAGTGEHVWLLQDIPTDEWDGLILKKDSAMALGLDGLGMMAKLGGLPGMEVFDNFASRFKALDNPEDRAYIKSKFPIYPGEPEYDWFSDEAFSAAISSNRVDLALHTTFFFDEIIMFGLSACAAAAAADEPSFDGKAMYGAILNTTFQGTSGTVAVDPLTGTRLPVNQMRQLKNIYGEEYNYSHVIIRVQQTAVFFDGHWEEREPFVYNGGTTDTPADLPPVTEDNNFIGNTLRAIGLTMAILVMCLSIAFAGWTVYGRKLQVVVSSQPIFLLILCLGTLVMGSAIIPLSIDDEIASDRGCSIACTASLWLACIGFALIFAGLFSKTWRVNRLFLGRQMRRVKVTVKDVILPFIVLLLLNVIVLSVWTAVAPLQWTREITAEDVYDRPIESRGFCSSDNFIPFIALLLGLDLGALIFASYQAYKARNISTEFAESEYIGKAIACMLLVSFVGVPTMIIVIDEPRAQFFVLTSIIFVLCTSVLVFIFVPKILQSKKAPDTARVKHAIRSSTVKTSRSNKVLGTQQSTALSSFGDDSEKRRMKEEIEELRLRVSQLSALGQDVGKLVEDETSRSDEECMQNLRDLQEEPESAMDGSEVFKDKSEETESSKEDCVAPHDRLPV